MTYLNIYTLLSLKVHYNIRRKHIIIKTVITSFIQLLNIANYFEFSLVYCDLEHGVKLLMWHKARIIIWHFKKDAVVKGH